MSSTADPAFSNTPPVDPMTIETPLQDATPAADLVELPPPAVNPADVPLPVKKLAMHMPQLDGIRGISAILIVVYHYSGDAVTDYGIILLGLFFVLSGFLITGILLDTRALRDAGKVTFWQAIKIFFARRFLRIFPLYYGVIIFLWLIDFRGMAGRVWWHLSYMTNYYYSYVADKATMKKIPERHFWSLSVEEQFYLAWPFIILLMPRRLLPWLLGLFFIGAPIYRLNMYTKGYHGHEWMTPCCLDLLATGAALSILYRTLERPTMMKLIRIVGVFGIAGMASFILLDYMEHAWAVFKPTPENPLPGLLARGGRFIARSERYFKEYTDLNLSSETRVYFNYTVIAVFGFWLIGSAANGFKGILGQLLAHRVMTYIGRISYGLYVLHMFTPFLARWLSVKYFAHELKGPWLFILCFIGTFAMAAAIWHVYESPLNDLKRHFTYRKKPTTVKV